MEVLYEGHANQLNTSYGLAKPISDYRILIAKIRVYTNNNELFGGYDTTVTITDPDSPVAHGILTSRTQTGSTSLFFGFTAAQSFSIIAKNLSGVSTGIEIVKIQGIK